MVSHLPSQLALLLSSREFGAILFLRGRFICTAEADRNERRNRKSPIMLIGFNTPLSGNNRISRGNTKKDPGAFAWWLMSPTSFTCVLHLATAERAFSSNIHETFYMCMSKGKCGMQLGCAEKKFMVLRGTCEKHKSWNINCVIINLKKLFLKNQKTQVEGEKYEAKAAQNQIENKHTREEIDKAEGRHLEKTNKIVNSYQDWSRKR